MNLNRCFNGDIVAMELLEEKEWQSQKHADFSEDQDEDLAADSKQSRMSSLENEKRLRLLFEKITSLKLVPTGRVVGIIQKSQKKLCGYISTQPDSVISSDADGVQIREFVPQDPTYPHFYMRLKNVTTP